ncbi:MULTISPECIES: hypothetical protein [Comamonas]|uniref:hypothetical protein n=1 Tax=Comamonas TaxID=283 RepID=UPI0007102EDF|nr:MULTISPECIES: hypothetical protein [Comamonas]TYK72797.1 hypothetical protein FSY59_08360 [Comamonas sp. Z3]
MKSIGIVLAVWLVLGLLQLAQAEPPSGCIKSAKTCHCFTATGKRVDQSPQICEAVMAPNPVKLAGGDLEAIAVKPKRRELEPAPFVKPPIPWLIER